MFELVIASKLVGPYLFLVVTGKTFYMKEAVKACANIVKYSCVRFRICDKRLI